MRSGRRSRRVLACHSLSYQPKILTRLLGGLGQSRNGNARGRVADNIAGHQRVGAVTQDTGHGPRRGGCAKASFTSAAVTSRPSTTVRSVSDPSSTGTRTATPSGPGQFGDHLPGGPGRPGRRHHADRGATRPAQAAASRHRPARPRAGASRPASPGRGPRRSGPQQIPSAEKDAADHGAARARPVMAAALDQSGLVAGAGTMWKKTEVSSQPVAGMHHAAGELDEKRPGQVAVDDCRRPPRPGADHQCPEPEEEQRRRDDVQAGATASRTAPRLCWLAAPAHVPIPARTPATSSRSAAQSEPPANHDAGSPGGPAGSPGGRRPPRPAWR